MKHTDKFFLFPVKVYNDEIAEDEVDPDWVLGYARIPIDQLYTITWFDTFTKGKAVSEVADKGCDLTKVISDKYGAYICLWPRKKFETKLNDYMDKIEKDLDNEAIKRDKEFSEGSEGQTTHY